MALVNKSLIIQVIIITVLIMMVGMLFYKEPPSETEEEVSEIELEVADPIDEIVELAN